MQSTLEKFEGYLKRRYQDRSTAKHYISDLRIFIETVGDILPVEVKAQDIDQFVEQQHRQGLSASTINRRVATLHTYFEYLASEEPDREWPNPVIWRRHGVKAGQRLPRDLSDEDVGRLFAVIENARDRAMFTLMVGAGLRVGEVAAIEEADLEKPETEQDMARLIVRGKGRKERIVWLTPTVYGTVQQWQAERGEQPSEWLFVNQHGRSLSVSGIQYVLKKYVELSGVRARCHRLRHTFARRLAEQEMPIESVSKLLGHAQVETTQIYTAGANRQLKESFAAAMAGLESKQVTQTKTQDVSTTEIGIQKGPTRQEKANFEVLKACLARLDDLPEWLNPTVKGYLKWRWRNWQPHMAGRNAPRLMQRLRTCWEWLLEHRGIKQWSDIKRSDLEVWLSARQEGGASASTRINDLSDLLSCLRYAVEHGKLVSANVFRVKYPQRPDLLPRYLSETEYNHVEQIVLAQTEDETFEATRDRAWFLTFAYTGIRFSELQTLQVSDVDLDGGRLFVRGGKTARERVVYLTPILSKALQGYLAQRKRHNIVANSLWMVVDGEKPLSDAALRQQMRKWSKLSGVQFSAQTLRHTLATRLVNQGMPLPSVAQLLGHKDLRMTQHYARIYDTTVAKHFQSAMEQIEGVAVSNWPQYELVFDNAETLSV